MASSFPALIAESLKSEKFRLLDIGCSGGLDPLWRAFEPRLQALGIDASVTECKRKIVSPSRSSSAVRVALIK